MRSLLALGALVTLLVLSLRQAAGRLAPRVAIAPVIFLATRWPVLLAWALGAAYWLGLLVTGMQAKGLDSPGNYAMAVAIALMCGGGCAVIAVGPAFMIARAFAAAPVLPLEDGEVVLHERAANHFLGGEGRGGKLLVTSRRLAFRPHRFNVQLATWSVPLAEVEGVASEGMRMMIVQVRGGRDEWLVVNGPERVAEYVKRVAGAAEEARGGLRFGSA